MLYMFYTMLSPTHSSPILVHCRAEERLSQRNSILVDNSVIMSLINQSMNR